MFLLLIITLLAISGICLVILSRKFRNSQKEIKPEKVDVVVKDDDESKTKVSVAKNEQPKTVAKRSPAKKKAQRKPSAKKTKRPPRKKTQK